MSNKIKKADITKCYGLLSDYKDDLEMVEKEAIKARKERWTTKL